MLRNPASVLGVRVTALLIPDRAPIISRSAGRASCETSALFFHCCDELRVGLYIFERISSAVGAYVSIPRHNPTISYPSRDFRARFNPRMRSGSNGRSAGRLHICGEAGQPGTSRTRGSSHRRHSYSVRRSARSIASSHAITHPGIGCQDRAIGKERRAPLTWISSSPSQTFRMPRQYSGRRTSQDR